MPGNFNLFLCFVIIFLSVIAILKSQNNFKKLMALGILQTAIIYFFIIIAYEHNSSSPVINITVKTFSKYSNPLPHVLMLTAIVVGLSIMAVGLALLQKNTKNDN